MRSLAPGGAPIREIITAVNQLIIGRGNSTGTITLTAGATTTTMTGPNVNTDGQVFLFPKTANAAAALSTTHATISRIAGVPTVTITHANAASTDRTFAYDIRGG